MKVLMIAPTPFFADRGCHVRIYEEARTLQERGHRVTIVTYHLGRDLPGFDIRRIPPLIRWYQKFEAGPSWWKFPLDGILFLKCLSRAWRERFDVIHAHLHEGALIGWLVSRLSPGRPPVVFDYQGSLTGEMLAHHFIREHRTLHGFFARVERLVNRLPDRIVASSTRAYEELTHHFTVAPERVSVALDGVHNHDFARRWDVDALRQALGLRPDRPVVVYLGVLSEYQGVDLLLRAIPGVREAVPGVQFLIMGYPNVERYRERVRGRGLEECVLFTGRVPYEEAARYLSLGDVAVAPKISRTEANGKLYNYMACGLPTVVFESEVNREILGDLGVYARFGDAEDLARKLSELLLDEEGRERLAKALPLRAEREHSWSASAARIEDVYRALLT